MFESTFFFILPINRKPEEWQRCTTQNQVRMNDQVTIKRARRTTSMSEKKGANRGLGEKLALLYSNVLPS